MSRCFPFPPPGYERKLDDTDLLKKEKLKKEHKKDKKDREKRESKHKEKKDKHREKKKDKEKRVDPQLESQNRDTLFHNDEHNKQKNGYSGQTRLSEQSQNGGHKELLIRKGGHVQPCGQTEKPVVNRTKTEDTDNPQFVQELYRRIREEKERTGSLQFSESRKSNVDLGNKSTVDPMSTGQNMINGKRKAMETNGFSHEHEPRPNKTARPTSSNLSENGKSTGLSQPGKSTDARKQKVNGLITSQPPLASQTLVKHNPARSPPLNTSHIVSQPSPVSSTKASQSWPGSKRRESTRPPHPDTMYLKQILAVPEVNRWSGLDNQEWLFSISRKTGNGCLQDKEVEVWCEAKRLEYVGVFALPYVVPY